jgi:two-component system, cell cycle response regulator DivK
MTKPVFLYIENDELSREVMKTLLTRGLGFRDLTMFDTSAHFEQHLEGLIQKPDVIFLDIHMEPVDGFEMLKMIRRNKDHHATRVIALTASVMNEEVRRLREAGFDGAIGKPINYDTFPSLLDRILNGEQIWNTK